MKEFFKKLWDFLSKPSLWFSVTATTCTLLFGGLSLWVAIVGSMTKWWAYPIFVIAAVSLFCCVLACIHHGNNLPSKLKNVAGRYAFTRKVWSDKEYRYKIVAMISLLFVLCYTAFLVVMAILEKSFWYASLAEYNVVLCVIRVVFLNEGRKAERLKPIECGRKKAKAYAACGGLIALLGLQFAFSVLGIVFRGETFHYAGLMIYVFAAVTVLKVVNACLKITRIRRHKDFTVRSIFFCNLASAGISVVALQTAMFDSFGVGGEINVPVFNGITGGVVCLGVITLGIGMLIHGIKVYKKMEKYGNGQ